MRALGGRGILAGNDEVPARVHNGALSWVASSMGVALAVACATGAGASRAPSGTGTPAALSPPSSGAPDAATSAAKPPPPPAPAPEPAVVSTLLPIVTVPYPDLDWAPFDDGVVLSARSLLVVVKGADVVQRPEWLAGLPEWINWDASTYVRLPLARSVPTPELPRGTALSAHAGNRHGPDAELFFDGSRFVQQRPPRDARLAKLPKASGYVEDDVLAFPSGELVVVRSGGEETEAFHFAQGRVAPTRTVVPTREAGYRRSLVGPSAKSVTFCDGSDSAWRYDGAAWSEIALDARAASCAVTGDGTLLYVTDSSKPELLRREPDGFRVVPLPDGLVPSSVAAGGDRYFVKAAPASASQTVVLSNRPVSAPLVVADDALPAPVFIDGITGLDVTSVDVISVSAEPAAPGTSACSSLLVWLGAGVGAELLRALGTPAPRLVEVSGSMPGQVVLAAGSGAQMRVQPSGKRRTGVAAIVPSYAEGRAVLEKVSPLAPSARLLCAKPRIVRELRGTEINPARPPPP